MLDVVVKRCDSIRCFFIVNVVVGVNKLLVNRFDSFDSLTTWVSFRKGKAMRRNYIVLNEKQIFTSLAISCPTIGRKL